MDPKDSDDAPSSNSNLDAWKDISLDNFGDDTRDVESNSSGSSATATSSSVQAGVKNIEAVSMTWTKWGLIAAYARFVEGICL